MKARQVLDTLGIESVALVAAIDEALIEQAIQERELCQRLVARRIAMLRRQLDTNPRAAFIANAINALELVIEELDGHPY